MLEPLNGGKRRLKSLDEFEPPPWRRKAARTKYNHIALALAGLLLGAALGFAIAKLA